MSRYSNTSKVAKCGAVDSKYFRNTDKFEKDVQAKIDKTEEFKNKIRELILLDPNLIELKEEFGI
ncbi:hypothetical protein [Clostridium septicum]|uniref:Uncharacterized protein n=1 Tax=Clostridium septicum TaxID=1504 RepID=A0A9N7PJZ1_CLOSE|nr:hypothetical protein [Clostridium septicum]AYE35291.1 hypothetical protein CP523_13130 [Clostridium septicum]UEC20057.1 hypothetical protein LK444_11660 [Clostridium septicum]USS01887.1 hypothetical protein NH397_05510 [Clostridium septicum]